MPRMSTEQHGSVPMVAGIVWVGDVQADMKASPAWQTILPWAAGCGHTACPVPDAVEPYVWERAERLQSRVMAQFAQPLPQGVSWRMGAAYVQPPPLRTGAVYVQPPPCAEHQGGQQLTMPACAHGVWQRWLLGGFSP